MSSSRDTDFSFFQTYITHFNSHKISNLQALIDHQSQHQFVRVLIITLPLLGGKMLIDYIELASVNTGTLALYTTPLILVAIATFLSS